MPQPSSDDTTPEAGDPRIPGAESFSDQDWAMAQLLACMSQRKTADELGINPKTPQRRMAEPNFADVVRRLRRQHYEDLVAALTTAAPKAVATLENHLIGEKPGPCIQAAKALLQFRFQAGREGDLRAEVERLERLVAGRTTDDSSWASWCDGPSSEDPS